MEKQETEMKRKLGIETGNENWKRKQVQKTHQSLIFFIVCLVISLVIYLALVIGLAL